ncbi:MAG: alpha-amylase family glycosyl hydrolase [Bacteroidota bacterium]|nr:alpha-amylase family glycosyl hydrolase [Bacteroidota bacterium]
MKIKYIIIFLLFISISSFSQVPTGNWSVEPDPFLENQQITFTVSNINTGNLAGINDIYLWTWYSKFGGGTTNPDSQWNGQWDSSNESMKMSKNSDGSYSFTFTPSQLFNDTGIETIGVLAKAKNGSGDKKTSDYIFEVGVFSLELISPQENIIVVEPESSLEILAEASVISDFILEENGNLIDQKIDISSYSYLISNINESNNYKLTATDNESGSNISREFNVVIKPSVSYENIPYDNLYDGLNFTENSVVLVFNAPGKEFVNIVGSFNQWEISNEFLMKYDDDRNRFWLEITGLDKKAYHSYQYLVDGSIYVADPYSPIILDSYNDSFVCRTEQCGFSAFPTYPKDNKHAATMFKIDDSFIWEDANFTPPDKENLVIYELLLRDFHQERSYQSVIDKLDYLQELGINAIELMPINEFDGNDSWGYNPSFHMALDKEYGSPVKFKELVNECHKRGIAVIVDVVYNHATGQNSYFRMWNTSSDSYDGIPTLQNPFFQLSPVSESYLNYFNDINHESSYVRDYMERINRFLIDEYHIDGFRFDLTKGMTNEVIAENYSTKRINYLKGIADDIWDHDPDSYVIFEHFQNSEERVFSDYGIMSWGEENYQYNEATMGYPSDFNGISHKGRGFPNPTLVGFMESHDKERLMYKNITYGNSSEDYDIKNFDTALDRMKAAGALFLTVPGPKMIWQFGELGFENSINTCEDGTVSESCKLSKKKSAFELGMQNDSRRIKLFNVWSRILKLRNSESIFKTNNFTTTFSSDLKYMILNDDSSENIKKVIVIANFGTQTKEVNGIILPNGEWYNIYANNSKITISDQNKLSLSPGQFIILADKQTSIEDDEGLLLSSEEKGINKKITIYPNPSIENFLIEMDKSLNLPLNASLFNSSGKLVWERKIFEYEYIFKSNFLSSGIYNLILTGNDFFSSKKIVKK